MLLTLAFAVGFFVGWRRAKARGGDRLDGLQYGAAHGIAFALLSFAAWILATQLGLL